MLDSETHIARTLTDMNEPFVHHEISLNIYTRDIGSREIHMLRAVGERF